MHYTQTKLDKIPTHCLHRRIKIIKDRRIELLEEWSLSEDDWFGDPLDKPIKYQDIMQLTFLALKQIETELQKRKLTPTKVIIARPIKDRVLKLLRYAKDELNTGLTVARIANILKVNTTSVSSVTTKLIQSGILTTYKAKFKNLSSNTERLSVLITINE